MKCQRCNCLKVNDCPTCGLKNGHTYYSRVVEAGADAIMETMMMNQAKHGDRWLRNDDKEEIDHILNHLWLYSDGDTSEPHIEHAITRLGFILARRRMAETVELVPWCQE